METLSVLAFGISVVAALFTGWAAIATARQARSARDQTEIQREQVDAAREQTRLQRELTDEAAQPYVWADIQPDVKQGMILDLVVGNNGPTVATDVTVLFDAPLPLSADVQKDSEPLLRTLAEGLRSMAPGREIRWHLGAGPDLLGEDVPQLLRIKVDASGPHGPLPTLEVPVDISQWRLSKDAPDGSLHLVRKSIQDLTKSVDKASDRLDRRS